MRYDLAFFLCCCKSFLGSDDDSDGNDFYARLGIPKDSSQDEIKRAYKRQSLQMHPDKLAQRGQQITEEDQAKFTKMKEAYEVLSDPHKRETYDTIGARGMKWLEEPFSVDPQELAHNFATSSALDRSKIFSIFVGVAVAVLILPILVCLHVDGVFGDDASWFATLSPLWIWDAFILFYHSRVIMMGPIARPDHIPPEEWVDPLPMRKRIFSLVRFVLIVLFELLVAAKLDGLVSWHWALIFFPLYVWEATTLYKKLPLARMRIVTVEDLETALGKPFSEFTLAEKELIGKRYSVVSSATSPDFDAAQKLKTRARHDIVKSIFRIVFVLLMLAQLDGHVSLNWWLIFTPFWVLTSLICFANYQAFAEVQVLAAEKDPTLFGLKKEDIEKQAGYGAVGANGEAPPPTKPDISEEEREELKAQVMASGSRLCSKCCSQGFFLIVVFLFLAKLQGAGFSSLWIISPCLAVVSQGLLGCLCLQHCLGCPCSLSNNEYCP
jgi:DnaJ domain